MLDRVRELVANVAVGASLYAACTIAIPCLSVRIFASECAYIMPHQTHFVLYRARVPFLEIVLVTFTSAHERKIEEEGYVMPFGG